MIYEGLAAELKYADIIELYSTYRIFTKDVYQWNIPVLF